MEEMVTRLLTLTRLTGHTPRYTRATAHTHKITKRVARTPCQLPALSTSDSCTRLVLRRARLSHRPPRRFYRGFTVSCRAWFACDSCECGRGSKTAAVVQNLAGRGKGLECAPPRLARDAVWYKRHRHA